MYRIGDHFLTFKPEPTSILHTIISMTGKKPVTTGSVPAWPEEKDELPGTATVTLSGTVAPAQKPKTRAEKQRLRVSESVLSLEELKLDDIQSPHNTAGKDNNPLISQKNVKQKWCSVPIDSL